VHGLTDLTDATYIFTRKLRSPPPSPLLALNRRRSKLTVKKREDDGNFKGFAIFTVMDNTFSFGQSRFCRMTSWPIEWGSSASHVIWRQDLKPINFLAHIPNPAASIGTSQPARKRGSLFKNIKNCKWSNCPLGVGSRFLAHLPNSVWLFSAVRLSTHFRFDSFPSGPELFIIVTRNISDQRVENLP